MKVEIWSDVMCPFCYIGIKKFEMALAQFPEKEQVEIEWKSFQLDPTIKSGANENYAVHLAERKGLSLQQVNGMFANVKGIGQDVGLELNFDKAIVANTFDAHRLTHLAAKYGLKNTTKKALFAAHFTEGLDIADHAVLLKIGTSIGLNETEINAMLGTELYAQEVKNDIALAEEFGVRGVPFFVLDRKFAVSGAQDSTVFLGALEKAIHS